MNICGIIAEYNPFHNGHLYQIEQARRLGATHIVAVMSGNFVQRGEAAIFSKWARAEAALLNGVDLVIALPTAFSSAPARDFASAGVFLLNQIGVNSICFGSENATVEELLTAAKWIEQAENSPEFKAALDSGVAHPVARGIAMAALQCKNPEQISRSIAVMTTPNNLLGIEYLRAGMDEQVKPLVINRTGAEHDSSIDTNKNKEGFMSASQIRARILADKTDEIKDYLPKSAFLIYKDEIEKGIAPCSLLPTSRILLYRLKTMTTQEISRIEDVCEGLENRIARAAKSGESVEALVEQIATKRYTKARIRRILLNCLLDKKKGDLSKIPEYVHILGLNQKGKEILNSRKSTLQISPKFADLYSKGYKTAHFESKSTDIYSLLSKKIMPSGREFTQRTILG